jgi:hypothetical protein
MPSEKQRSAARKNIRKAATAAKKKRTIAHLPKSARTALGKQAAKVAQEKRRQRRRKSVSAVAIRQWKPSQEMG